MAENFDVADHVKVDTDAGTRSGRIAMFCRDIGNAEPWAWIAIDQQPIGIFCAVPVALLQAGDRA